MFFFVIVNLACKRNRGEFGRRKERGGEKSVVKRRENVEIVRIVSCWNGRFLLNQESV